MSRIDRSPSSSGQLPGTGVHVSERLFWTHFMPNGTEHYDLSSPYAVETSCRHFRDGAGEPLLSFLPFIFY